MDNEKTTVRITILECQELARQTGPLSFDFCGPAGRSKAIWVDAEAGVFKYIDKDKSHNINDMLPCGKRVTEIPFFWCENIEYQELN